MKNVLMTAAAAAMLTAGLAQAQTPAPAAPAAPAAAPAPAASVSDAELTRFGKLARDIKGIMDKHRPNIAGAADAEAKAKAQSAMTGEMQVAVLDNGFSVDRYNEIATAMQKDPTLLTRMQQLAAAKPAATTP